MKRLLSFALVFMMVFALAVPAMAAENPYKEGNRWYYDAVEAGTLTVADNNTNFTYEVVAGKNLLGLQSGYNGQLQLVSFEPAAPVDPCANGHDIITDTVAATCVEDGYIKETCSRCNYENITVLDALGHRLNTRVTDPTCTEDGRETVFCNRANCDYKVVTVIPALGHDPEWVLVSETAKGLTVNKKNGNTNDYVFATAIYSENVCKRDGCGAVVETKTENSSITLVLANNYKGIVTVGDSTVSIDVKGNTDVRVFEVLGKK